MSDRASSPTIEALRALATAAAAHAAREDPRNVLDLSDERLDDFLEVYIAGDRVKDDRHIRAWRTSLRSALEGLRPVRQDDGRVTISGADIRSFQGYLHRNDVLITIEDYHRRAHAFVRAIPHVAP